MYHLVDDLWRVKVDLEVVWNTYTSVEPKESAPNLNDLGTGAILVFIC